MTPSQEIMDKIISQKNTFLKNVSLLRKLDPHDDYWRMLCDVDAFTHNNIFLESGMVIMWIGCEYKPKRILEIGTRTGGSLISLLCTYSQNDFKKIEEIVSFDLWREYFSVTPLASFISKIFGKKRNINVSPKRLEKIHGKIIERQAINKVRKNLSAFLIPSDKINFISGDSKKKVPTFFAMYPQKKFDYILVDGGHDEVTAYTDLKNIVDYCDKQGVIIFDDIAPESYNLLGVWEKFKSEHKEQFDFYEIMHRKGIAWAIRK
ncbi:MAG: class I SAM-dependent methyltransferase [Bacteroidota bacterium]